MTKAELEEKADRMEYQLDIEKTRKEIIDMVNGCSSLITLKEMKGNVKELYHRHTTDWVNVALRDNLCDLAKQLSDNYEYETLRNINVILYAMVLKNGKIDTDSLFLTPYMESMKQERNIQGGAA